MDRKVNLQISCDLEDVPKVVGASLTLGTDKAVAVQNLLYSATNVLKQSKSDNLDKIKQSFATLEEARTELVKIDNRIADSLAVLSNLISLSEAPPQQEQKQEKAE